jgi:NADH-quinone oxidoreductase subunit C/D
LTQSKTSRGGFSSAMSDFKQDIEKSLGPKLIEICESNGQPCAVVDHRELLSVFSLLRNEPRLNFDMLVDIVGIDALNSGRLHRFEVVYLLKSIRLGHRLKVCCRLPAENPVCPSISSLYSVADWLEREVWDQFGIVFEGHPNLRRLLNHKDFIGHPLRKDYPIHQRQSLSESDDLLDEMKIKLARKGRSTENVRIEEYCGNNDFSGDDIDKEHTFLVNLGPSHPVVHGILRLLLAVEGETIVAAVSEIGYLHRGAEKSMEAGNYHQVIPFTDRLNYVSPAMNNIGYCKAVEKMLGIQISETDTLVRVVLCELARIMDHLVCIGPHLIDLGALTPFWYLFQVRELIYDIMEKYSGARLTYSCIRIGSMPCEMYPGFSEEIEAVLKRLDGAVNDVRRLVERNRIFYDRCNNVGKISGKDAVSYGFTGPCLRAAGIEYDLRKAEPYYMYDQFDFSVVIGTNGDTYDRFFVRVYEMIESAKIIRQALGRLKDTPPQTVAEGTAPARKTKGFKKVAPPAGEIYDYTEAANGELGFYIVSDGSANPYRIKVRSPSLCNYSAIEQLTEGGMIADLVSTIGSLNIIGGEIDR